MLLHRGGREIEIAGTTDSSAARADQLQLETGVGPCLAVARDDAGSAMIGDTRTGQRWLAWSSCVADELR